MRARGKTQQIEMATMASISGMRDSAPSREKRFWPTYLVWRKFSKPTNAEQVLYVPLMDEVRIHALGRGIVGPGQSIEDWDAGLVTAPRHLDARAQLPHGSPENP